MPSNPPAINPVSPVGGSKTKKGTGKGGAGTKDTTYIDPYQFGVTGENTYLGQQAIPGASAFFSGQPLNGFSPGKPATSIFSNPQAVHAELTADEAMLKFQHLSGQDLAQIQLKMYRAGLYGNTAPLYGQLHPEDSTAFRSLLTGLATNPTQGTLNSYLDQAADQGDKQGVNAVRKAPLVIHHMSDDTLKMTFQSAAKQILGDGKIPDDELNRMVGAYHSLETSSATAAYNAGDPNATGILYGGLGGEVTDKPDPSAFAATQLQAEHPDQIARQQFSDSFGKIAQTFTSPGLA